MLQERQARILQFLKRDGRVVAAQLAAEFSVSEDTIRRDLREMASAGLCERVYGGALPAGRSVSGLAERIGIAPDRKQALARSVVELIPRKAVVFFDAGSTNLAVAEALPDNYPLTVLTNAPTIAVALHDRVDIETILIGGRIDRIAGGAVGAKAIEALSTIHPDICLIGTCGVGAKGELSAFGFEDAAFKSYALSRSRHVIVAATAEKFSVVAPYSVAAVEQYHCLVAERDADAERLQIIRESGCNVVVTRC
jgi:DeoR/GlpR family transcriptional regulator of sugar metabolism